MKKAVDIDDNMWAHINSSTICFDHSADTDRFIEMAKSTGMDFDVIFFDSLYGFVEGDLNSNKTAKDVTRSLRRIAGEFQASIVVLTHTGKDQFTTTEGKKIDKGKGNVYGARHWGAFFTKVFHFARKKGIHILSRLVDRDWET